MMEVFMLSGMAWSFARFVVARRPLLTSLVAAFGLLSLAVASQPPLTSALAADTKGKVTIYVVRHGETDWNQQGRIQGSTDNSLNAKGREQASGIASQLALISVDHIYSSGLTRAIQTAEAFKGKAPLTSQPMLNERSFGIYEGKIEKEVASELSQRVVNLSDDMGGGESLASMAKRVGQATREIVERHPGGTVMIVAHGGVNPLVIGELIGLVPEKAIKEIRQSNDEVYKLEVFGKDSFNIWKLIPVSKLDQL
jgi:probable phosphoglycerate mutase